MRFVINELIDRSLWKDLILTCSFASPYQSSEFYELFQQIPGYAADVFAIEVQQKILALAVVTIHQEPGIKRFFSRRGIIYGGPVFNNNNSEAANALINGIKEYYGSSLIYIETRNLFNYSEFKAVFLQSDWDYIPYLNFHLSSKSQEIIWKNFNRRRRREIRIAKESGVTAGPAASLDEVRALYEIIRNIYVERIKKPILPWSFFKSFYFTEVCRVIVVKFDKKIIGGVICASYLNKVLYLWYGNALSDQYRKLYPLVMTFHGAIQYAVQNNYEYIDFMGAGKPAEKYTVRDFKAEFGGELVEHGRFRFISNRFLFNIGEMGLKFLSKMG